MPRRKAPTRRSWPSAPVATGRPSSSLTAPTASCSSTWTWCAGSGQTNPCTRSGRPLPEWYFENERDHAWKSLPTTSAMLRALDSYAAPSTRCKVTYFSADAHVRAAADDAVCLIDGPGITHHTLMKEPHVRRL